MERLPQAIESIRSRLDSLRKRGLKETPTRTIVIDPLLGALGWDVCDPDEVELEYPTVDSKSVDYALKINHKCVLLVEAKALDDPLEDVKAITQIVGYAANNGIVWCVLTNGVRWQVYKSDENCQAPDKLMFEISIDPRDTEAGRLIEVMRQLWRLSREEVAKGTLDVLGEQTFTDGRVRKAIDALMHSPPRPLLNMIRKAMGNTGVSPKQITESLGRVWGQTGLESVPTPSLTEPTIRHKAAERAWETRRAKQGESPRDEGHHLNGKPREAVELFRAIERQCLAMGQGVTRRYLEKCIQFECGGRAFCSVHVLRGGLRVWLWLKYGRLQSPPPFVRDVANVGHWGGGDLELGLGDLSQVEEAAGLIRQSFEERCTRMGR